MNLHDLFAIPARRSPTKVAIDFPSVSLTYLELLSAADALAAGLAQRGIVKGDRVLFFLSNRPEFVIAYLAVIRLGAIMVPANLRYRRMELNHILADCTPRLIVTEEAQCSILAEAGITADRWPILPVEQLARCVDTIPYELLCNITSRVQFSYINPSH